MTTSVLSCLVDKTFGGGSSSSSSRTYRLTRHKLNTIASRTWYTNYREKKIKLMGRIWYIKMLVLIASMLPKRD